jgi:hypothetical protein
MACMTGRLACSQNQCTREPVHLVGDEAVRHLLRAGLSFLFSASTCFYNRDRGDQYLIDPSHTTRHAGPHRAVREVEVM